MNELLLHVAATPVPQLLSIKVLAQLVPRAGQGESAFGQMCITPPPPVATI